MSDETNNPQDPDAAKFTPLQDESQQITVKVMDLLRDLTGKFKQPPHYKKYSRGILPYYKPQFALQMKQTIDRMIQNRTRLMMFYYQDTTLSARSLYLKVQQSMNYLIDNLDENGLYLKVKQVWVVNKIANKGVRVEIDFDQLDILLHSDGQTSAAENVSQTILEKMEQEFQAKEYHEEHVKTPFEQVQEWLDKLHEKGDKLELKNINPRLTPDEIDMFNGILDGLEETHGLISTVNEDKIIIRKVS